MTNDNSGGGSNNGMLYFLVGALFVAVAIGGFFMFNGGTGSSVAQAPAAATAAPAAPATKNVTIERTTIETPKVIERR
jgi:hypothetical protein